MNLTIQQTAAMLAVALFTVAVPLGLMLVLHRRGGKWSTFLVGAGTFVLFALVLEQGLHAAVLLSPLGATIQGNIWLYGLYGGLAAGLFEETGRLVAFRFFLKRELRPITALTYGVGHGGIEAILITGMTMVSNIVLVSMASAGAITDPLVLAQLEALTATPAGMFLWAAFERCSAILLHIANSVLVFAAVRQKKVGLYVLAILFHAGCNFMAVVLNRYVPVAVTELAVLAFAVLVALLAKKVYGNLQEMEENP